MALAMFVGCDNAPAFPDMPQSVKSGYIEQVGDFLTGQAYDSNKFSVMAVSDNGSEQVVPGTIIDFGGNPNSVANGDSLSAVAGMNFEGTAVPAYGSLKAYTITRLEVTGPASYEYKADFDIPSSDLTVTAYYLDSENVEKSMILSSTEFDVGTYSYADGIKPAASRPEVATTAIVRPNVGYANGDANDVVTCEFAFSSTFVPASEELPGDIVALKSVDVSNIVLPAYKYADVPQPNFEDVVIKVLVDGQNTWDKPFSLTADPGVKLYYVDANGDKLATSDLSGLASSNLYVAVELDGYDTIVSIEPVVIQPVSVKIIANNEAEFVAGADLVAPSASDFVAEAKIGSSLPYIYEAIPSGVEYKYYVTEDGGDDYKEYTAKTVPAAGTTLYVAGTYMGVTSNYVEVGTTVAAPKPPVYGLAVSAVEDLKAPAKQQYNDIDAALALTAEDVSVLLTKDGKPVEVDPSKLTVAYSTSATEFKAVTGDDLSDVNELYIYASYKDGDIVASNISEDAVSLVDAKATDFEFNHKYQYVDSKNNPMYGATINYTVTTFNNLGTVEDNVAIGTVLEGITYTENGYVVTGLIDKVDATEHTYIVVATLSGTTTPVEKTITIKAGTGYYDVTGLDAADIKFDMPARGSEISKNTRDYTIATENSWKSVGNPSADGKPAVTRVVTDFTGEKVALDGSSTADVVISYLGADGKTAEKTITIGIPGYAWSDISKMELTYPDHPEVADGKLYAGVTYNYSSFELSGDVTYGENDDKAEITDCYVGKENLADKGTFTLYSSQEPITFVVEYVAADGTTSTTTISLTLVANPEA